MRTLRLSHLAVRELRNLAEVDLDPGPRLNVLFGDNGQGKTNLLEAIYALCTTRSFRTSKVGELLRHGDETNPEGAAVASVRGTLIEGDVERQQSVGFQKGARVVRIDGARPRSLAEYASRTPVVVFSPGEVGLSMGGGQERRRLLDRVALYRSPVSLGDVESYQRAVRERQRALEVRGEGATDLESWEELVVRHGIAVMNARAQAAEPLAEEAVRAFERIAAPGLHLEVSYRPSAPRDPEAYGEELRRRRTSDRRRGSAGVGPHRDDLELLLDGRPARGVASQGQHRAIVLSLKSAELRVVSHDRDARPILLLDDVSSELDRSRTSAFFAFLHGEEGQVFLTTTRPELIEADLVGTPIARRDFEIVAGRIQRVR